MRLLAVLFWAVLAVLVAHLLTRMLRRPPRPVGPPAEVLDELVQDPVCHTYVVRSRAVRREGTHGTRYFCSDECASRASGG